MLKVFEYQGTGITFDFEGETFINATEMAKPFGKRVTHFLQLKSSLDYLEALKSDVENPVITRRGNFSEQEQGTWMHELLALEFAGWLAPAFKVWCNRKVRELLINGQASIKPMTMEEMMIKQLESMHEQRLRLEKVESDVKYIQHSREVRPEYFTIAGYASFIGMNINVKDASMLGRRAAQYCKLKGIPMDETPDPRFGHVKMYPKKVLDKIFNERIIKKKYENTLD